MFSGIFLRVQAVIDLDQGRKRVYIVTSLKNKAELETANKFTRIIATINPHVYMIQQFVVDRQGKE